MLVGIVAVMRDQTKPDQLERSARTRAIEVETLAGGASSLTFTATITAHGASGSFRTRSDGCDTGLVTWRATRH